MSQHEELLTSEEMSALMPEANAAGGAAERPGNRQQRVMPYNFRRPDRLSKEQLRSLYLLHDAFAHNLSSSLPLFLRAMSEVNLLSVEQLSYGDYLRGLSDPTVLFTLAASGDSNSLNGTFAIEISPSITFPIIDRMLGGEGTATEKRAATELELEVLEGFLSVIIDDYCEAWKPTAEFKTALAGRETQPQLLQIVSPNEVVAVAQYQIQIGEDRGTLNICLPVTMLESVIENFNQASYSPTKPASAKAVRSMLQTISGVKFPLVAELAETSAIMSDLMRLSIGDVLQTAHRVEQPVRVSVDGALKFKGALAASGDGRIVVRITEVKNAKTAAAATTAATMPTGANLALTRMEA